MEKYFSRLFFFVLNLLLILLLPSSLSITSPPSLHPSPPKCHKDEQSALLEFKEDLNYTTSSFYSKHEVRIESWKLDSWKLDGGDGNCCTWDGVECDAKSGHVIGLDLCCTHLNASIDSSSSLFGLVHLQKLNLAYTDLNQSLIPSAIGNLTRLSSLNLSRCGLTGQIPEQILGLTNLSSLDLSGNDHRLELAKPSLEDLALRLTKLEELDLTTVSVSSPLPHALANLSSLTSLTLVGCGLEGHLPLSVFSIPNPKVLNLRCNSISGHLPEFHQGSQLKSLLLDANNLSGGLSVSINHSTELTVLSLSFNRFRGTIPSFANMTQLRSLFLSFNRLSGTVHLDRFLELGQLDELSLDFNNLSVVANSNMTTSSSSKLTFLGLGSCNLHEFPKLLLSLQQLLVLDLSSNNIHGQVPLWFQDVSRQNLVFLNLSSNSLTGFEGNSVKLKWEKLGNLDLSFNKLRGSLPLPPEPISFYRASKNRLSGDIPPLVCSWRFIKVLDLAKNNFTGVIPPCISNLSNTLTILSLHDNNLHGGIPQVPDENCSMRMLDLHSNQLQGPLPRSLSRRTNLEFLNVGDNIIEDTFPSWLGAITHLRVLILQSNGFRGAIEESKTGSEFQSLQIIDLSWNSFENYLPAKYFQYWTSMKEPIVDYLGQSTAGDGCIIYRYQYTLTIMNKGMEMKYEKILGYLQAIDFSGNDFSGEIPESIANLRGLRLLNISNNNLSGPIPPIMGCLTNMESLDFSGNNLSGEIPQQLTQLNFLGFLNQLSGPIPRGTQFDTFQNTSYEGNEGLCGVPLSRTCSSLTASPSASSLDKKDYDDALQIEWKAAAAGFVAGFAIATVIGHKIITSRPDWFSRAFGFVEQRRWR